MESKGQRGGTPHERRTLGAEPGAPAAGRGAASIRAQRRVALAMVAAWCGSCGESPRGLLDAALRRAATLTEAEAIIATSDYEHALRLIREAMGNAG